MGLEEIVSKHRERLQGRPVTALDQGQEFQVASDEPGQGYVFIIVELCSR
jgi:hypothetical protein